MLYGNADALALHAFHICRGQLAGDDGILAEIFKVSAAERAALAVETRAEQNIHAFRARGFAKRRTELLKKRSVKRAGCQAGGGKANGGQRRFFALLAGKDFLSQPVRPVGHGNGL
ncbi:hypothetical protein SDC9_111200 [bioreactor metagenome]|uniref:Uncharacterized protein n=1 Tax=bioreactor metagenome TaxID=1076179 RepID=A0A645BR58_9ZZZZ